MGIRGVAWVLALTAFASAAHAQESTGEVWTAEPQPAAELGDDEVLLKNGGVIRGTVLALEPDKEVVIQIHGKSEPRTIPWEEVAEVQRGKHARSRAEPAKPQKRVVRKPKREENGFAPERKLGLVKLHIVSDDENVYLHELVGVSKGFSARGHYVVTHSRPVCRAPCAELVDARDGQQFFFSGESVTDSDSFTLADRQGDVTARVDAGSKSLRNGSYAVLAVGGLMTALGIVGTVVAYAFPQPEGAQPNELADAFKIAGPVVLGVGVAALVGGIFMIDASRTRYRLDNGARTARWWRGEF